MDDPVTIKPNFSTLDSTIESSRQEPLIGFTPDDSISNLLGFIANTIFEEYNISPNPVDILSFDNVFLSMILPMEQFSKEAEAEYFMILPWMSIPFMNK